MEELTLTAIIKKEEVEFLSMWYDCVFEFEGISYNASCVYHTCDQKTEHWQFWIEGEKYEVSDSELLSKLEIIGDYFFVQSKFLDNLNMTLTKKHK